jgi:hypothetical protein
MFDDIYHMAFTVKIIWLSLFFVINPLPASFMQRLVSLTCWRIVISKTCRYSIWKKTSQETFFSISCSEKEWETSAELKLKY